jgi:glucose-6-phosphate 1-epimerase
VDRVYANTPATVEILDLGFKRSIRIEKSGSASTVVWNPWIEKSKRMADFGDDEYPHMVCVESGNVGENTQTLAPGETAVLWVRVTSV